MKMRAYRGVLPIDQAAERLGVTSGYLSQLERGLKWPGPFIIRKIQEWSRGQVTVQDIFDNLDMSLFGIKPIRSRKGRPSKGSTHHGDPINGEKDHIKRAVRSKTRREKAAR